MTPAEAVKELAQGLTHPDEVAKRLWEAGVLMRQGPIGLASYCPIARYVQQKAGITQQMSVGVKNWSVRRTSYKGHLPQVLRQFVQLYDNGDYDNLISEEVRHG